MFWYCREHAKFDSFQVIKKWKNNFNTLVYKALLMRRHIPKLNKRSFQKLHLFHNSKFISYILYKRNNYFVEKERMSLEMHSVI